jgi:hypothetical protein
MKQIIFFLGGIFLLFAGCSKQQLNLNAQNQLLGQNPSLGNQFDPLKLTSSIKHVNPTHPAQSVENTIPNLYPNSTPFSDNKAIDFGNIYAAIKCPIPPPRSKSYLYAFPDDFADGVVPKPLCPEMDDFFSRIDYRFSKKSPNLIYFEVYFKSSQKLIYQKLLTKTSSRNYFMAGDINSVATNAEVLNYVNKKDENNTKALVTKLFNFLNTSLVTSN